MDKERFFVPMLYLVSHRSSSDDDSLKLIGIFSSPQKATDTVDFYQKEVVGFCDFPSGFAITSLSVSVGSPDTPSKDLFLITSWKAVDDAEEDVRTEAVFTLKRQAVKYRLRYRLLHPFRKCIIDKYILDRPEWREGFIIS